MNRRPSPTEIEAVVEGYDRMMHRLVQAHAPEFTEVGITMAQAKVLYVVMAAGRLLGIGSSSASEMADRLVELGLLLRNDDPDDRRQVVVTATPAAAALLERFRELNLRQLRELLGRLDGEELDVVGRSLAILLGAIDRAVGTDPGPTIQPTTTQPTTTQRENQP